MDREQVELTITFDRDPSYSEQFWAKTIFKDHVVVSGGNSYEEAEKRLVEKLKVLLDGDPVPEPKKITL